MSNKEGIERVNRNIAKIEKWNKEPNISKQRKKSLNNMMDKMLSLKKYYEGR